MVWKSKKKQSHMKNQTTSKEKYIFTWHVLEKNSADNEALFLAMFLQIKGPFSIVSTFRSHLCKKFCVVFSTSSPRNYGKSISESGVRAGSSKPHETRHNGTEPSRGFSVHQATGTPWELSQLKHTLILLKE